MRKPFEAVVRLRRDNDYNFERIKDNFIPAHGEVILVDTAQHGLRAKVGDGYSTYAQLQFVDEDIRNQVQQGYYVDQQFYKDSTLSTKIPKMVNKIYIDKPNSAIYYFNGEQYVNITGTQSTASADIAGTVKLYNTTGYNTDGTMTQKSITDELDLRFKTDIDEDNELLIFTL